MNNVITNANGVKVKVRVYDIGDGEIDRYTIICVSDKGKDSNGLVYYPVFACSENPFHPQGIGIYVVIIIHIGDIHTISVKELRI